MEVGLNPRPKAYPPGGGITLRSYHLRFPCIYSLLKQDPPFRPQNMPRPDRLGWQAREGHGQHCQGHHRGTNDRQPQQVDVKIHVEKLKINAALKGPRKNIAYKSFKLI